MIREADILIQQSKQAVADYSPLINLIKNRLIDVSCDETVDIAFASREAQNNLELILKELRDLSRKAENSACQLMEQIGEEKIRTEYCTASPNPRVWYALPHKREGKEQLFDGMMDALGIPKEVYENELVRFHPPAFMDYCTKRIGECKESLFGIDPKRFTGVELNLRITTKKGSND